MVDITDNKFSNDFIEGMIKDNRIPSKRSERSCGLKKDNISRSEILACWDNGLSYYYKDEYRTRRPDHFIQADSDGSEFLVRLIVPEHAASASDILYETVKKLCKKEKGHLYCKIYNRPSSRYTRERKNNIRPVPYEDFC